jgi:hypothetical protein
MILYRVYSQKSEKSKESSTYQKLELNSKPKEPELINGLSNEKIRMS